MKKRSRAEREDWRDRFDNTFYQTCCQNLTNKHRCKFAELGIYKFIERELAIAVEAERERAEKLVDAIKCKTCRDCKHFSDGHDCSDHCAHSGFKQALKDYEEGR